MPQARPVTWVGSSRQDLKKFPEEVRRDLGQALYAAQQGETDPAAKPLTGFGGARVMEIALIRRRLTEAERLHRQRSH